MPDYNADLSKYPRLLVTGDPVTHEQANDILIRTADWQFHLYASDYEWQQHAYDLASMHIGFPVPPGDLYEDAAVTRAYTEALRQWRDRLSILNLTYLGNDQILSSRIWGHNGWCDWDGIIGCNTYNVGKWPSVERITQDWTAIAAAWPFLSLRAQAVTDEGGGHVAAEWRIHAGAAELVDPGSLIAEPHDPAPDEIRVAFHRRDRQHGVSPDRLEEALRQAAVSRGLPRAAASNPDRPAGTS